MANAELANPDSALVVRRRIPSSPENVFRAFTDAVILKQWMGPGDVECVSAHTEPRVGGSYRIHMRSSEGDHVVIGRYLEIVPARRLVFTWSWESGTVADSVVTITFHASGDGTDIELMHEKLPGRDSVEKHTAGWNGCLDNLVAHYGKGK